MLSRRGRGIRETGRFPRHEGLCENTHDRMELAPQNHGDTKLQRELALSHIDVAAMLADIGRNAESVINYAKRNDSPSPRHGGAGRRRDSVRAGASLQRLGDCARCTELARGGAARFEQARAVLERLVDNRSTDTGDQRRLATAHSNIALPLGEVGHTDTSVLAVDNSRSIYQKLADANPTAIDPQDDLATSDSNLRLLFSSAGRYTESLAARSRDYPALGECPSFGQGIPSGPGQRSHQQRNRSLRDQTRRGGAGGF